MTTLNIFSKKRLTACLSDSSTAARSGAAIAQRARQRRTVLGEQATWCAISSLDKPAAAARTIWLRRTRACGALCWRSQRSRIARWEGEMVMGTGCGPGIGLLSRTQGNQGEQRPLHGWIVQ